MLAFFCSTLSISWLSIACLSLLFAHTLILSIIEANLATVSSTSQEFLTSTLKGMEEWWMRIEGTLFWSLGGMAMAAIAELHLKPFKLKALALTLQSSFKNALIKQPSGNTGSRATIV
uniref:Uncharacterized protein n=1 Tax=Lotharella globosa TaxID=91324 RepID=A0A7S3Z189_9EUKA